MTSRRKTFVRYFWQSVKGKRIVVEGNVSPGIKMPRWLAQSWPAVAVPVVPVTLVLIRVIRVAHGHYQTELSLINSEHPISVLFGSLAPAFSYLVLFVIVSLAVIAKRMYMSTTSLAEYAALPVAALVPLALLTFGTLPLGAMLSVVVSAALTFGIVWVLYPFAVPRHDRRHGRILLCTFIVFLLCQLGFDDRMWVPVETIQYAGRSHIGYVVEVSQQDVTFMDESMRSILYVPPTAVKTRQVCALDLGQAPRAYRAAINLQNPFPSWPSILQAIDIDPKPSDLPSCGG